MNLSVSTEAADKLETDVVVLLFFSDERPLKGASGLIDWRLNGGISRLIETRRITGDKGETTLIAPQGRIRGEKIMLIGLGSSSQIKPLDIERTAIMILEKLIKIGARKVTIAAPPKRFSTMDSEKAIASLVKGMMYSGNAARHIQATLLVEDRDVETVNQIVRAAAE